MLRGVVFDMDGVVIDSHPLHKRAWKSFFDQVGCQVTDSELEFILDGRKREEILCHFLGRLTRQQIANYGAQKDQKLRELHDGIHALRGVAEFLKDLSRLRIRIALATSASRGRAKGTLEELGFARYFDEVVTGDEVVAGKPDPSIYRLVAQRLDEDPRNLLAVEDAVSGVKSARAAGMRCLGIASASRAHHLLDAGADLVIPDFESFSCAQLNATFT